MNISELMKDYPLYTKIYNKKGKEFECSKWGENYILQYYDSNKCKNRFTFRTKEELNAKFFLNKKV